MSTGYQHRVLPYAPSAAGTSGTVHHPVIVVGGGPVGLTAAIDIARHGTRVLLLDDDTRHASGSRAICFAKRSLEIWDRLGCGDAIAARGVSWQVGNVYLGDRLLYSFDLLPEPGHRRPAFVNLQQYYVEGLLYDHALTQPDLEMRFGHRAAGVEQTRSGVVVTVDTRDGPYRLSCDYLVACDGCHSTLRGLLGLEARGQVFQDRFLIADVRMSADLPSERRFWFDPPFHRQGSALMHRQPDDIWRIDFQLGPEADPHAERAPERVSARVRAMLGADARFEIVWSSVYTFACMRLDSFRHGRVLFAGDAAHGVSPFGARGANSGVEDADNLAWKLHYVLQGRAPERLLDTYCAERERAADENIAHSTRSANFLTPANAQSRLFRDAVLGLARDHPFARTLVNSGRLSTAATLEDSPLNTPDDGAYAGVMAPGAAAADAPVDENGERGWFLQRIGGRFVAAHFSDRATDAAARRFDDAFAGVADDVRNGAASSAIAPLHVHSPGNAADAPSRIRRVGDVERLLAERYDAAPGTTYLFRPDGHVCARWRNFDPELLRRGVARATCNG